MRRLMFALIFALLPSAAISAPAAPSKAAAAALAVTDRYVLPRYQALAAAAFAQQHAWERYCHGRARPQEETLDAAYHAVADRWAEIEFVKTGPMTLFFRRERFNYWPDTRNATQRNLDALLASRDPKALEAQTLAHDSIPAQGLSALERLLYDPAYARHAQRCEVGLGIARNLAAIASSVLADWAGAAGVRFAITANRSWKNRLIGGSDEAARQLMTDLAAGLTAMNDQKLLTPMGASAAAAKPRAAEAWRSRRSARNLVLNLIGLRAMAAALAAGAPAAVRTRVEAAFAATEAALKALPPDIGAAAASPVERRKLEAARAALKGAQAAVVNALAPALGTTLGFNALDGD